MARGYAVIEVVKLITALRTPRLWKPANIVAALGTVARLESNALALSSVFFPSGENREYYTG